MPKNRMRKVHTGRASTIGYPCGAYWSLAMIQNGITTVGLVYPVHGRLSPCLRHALISYPNSAEECLYL